MTYPQAVEEALCFGWIDGIGRRIDDEVHAQPLHATNEAQHLERGQRRAHG